MLSKIKTIVSNIASMSVERKKERLVEIKTNQLQREKLSGDPDKLHLSAEEELESTMILSSLFPLDSSDDVLTTINSVVGLREEITQRAVDALSK